MLCFHQKRKCPEKQTKIDENATDDLYGDKDINDFVTVEQEE